MFCFANVLSAGDYINQPIQLTSPKIISFYINTIIYIQNKYIIRIIHMYLLENLKPNMYSLNFDIDRLMVYSRIKEGLSDHCRT